LMKHFLKKRSLDARLNISTSHFTSTPSAFEVILQLTRYTNYLLTYLFTYSNNMPQLIVHARWQHADARDIRKINCSGPKAT